MIRLVGILGLLLVTLTSSSLRAEEGKKYAILIGINKYEKRGFDNLQFAEKDVDDLEELLKDNFEITKLKGSLTGRSKANKENILAAFQTVFAKMTKEDTLLIALAGHGQQSTIILNEQQKEEAFFCPCDALTTDIKTLISFSSIMKDIDEKGGKTNLMLVDACRNDPDPTRGRGGIDGSRFKDLPEGVAVVFSCSRMQRAYETDKAGGGHGIFFHYVIEGLKGHAGNKKGEVTWGRLIAYVDEEMSENFATLVPTAPFKQTPQKVSNLTSSPVLARRTPPVAPRVEAPIEPPMQNISRKHKLVGDWRLTMRESEGNRQSDEEVADTSIRFDNANRMLVLTDAGQVPCTVRVDADNTPGYIDVIDAEGKVEKGIYRLQGNRLTICYADAGQARPTEFDAPEGFAGALLVLESDGNPRQQIPQQNPPNNQGGADRAKFIGTWKVVTVEANGNRVAEDELADAGFKLIFTNNALTIRRKGAEDDVVTWSIDPTTSPKSINTVKGGKTELGIYDFDGTTLSLCIAQPDNDRPTRFDAPSGFPGMVLVLRKE